MLLALLAGLTPLAVSAQPVAPYQGIYVVINPYNTQHVGFLQTAAAAPCPQNPASPISPFCGAASGILLRINWCDFQLYHIANPAGGTYPSCHYMVGEANGVPPITEVVITDTISPCTGSYDTCATKKTASVLGASLALIARIDANRAAAGLPPLQLSIGLAAGSFTAQTVIDSVGSVDLPVSEGQTNTNSYYDCVRLPLPWKSAFLKDYNTALGQLLSYLVAQLGPANAAITILKPSAIAASSLELNMPGHANIIAVASDPGNAGPGSPISCPTTVSGASQWLSLYNHAAIKGQNFSEAMENTFGSVIGNALGALKNLGYANVLLSIPTNNATAFAAVDCGASGTATCTVPNEAKAGNYSLYDMDKYIDDLFDGGLSASAARTAYNAIRSDTFSLPATQLAINSTALSPTPIVASAQVECTLNNTNTANATLFTLDGNPVWVVGSGTVLGWQTLFNEGGACAAGTYGTILSNGIASGALFEEVETDAAFTDLPSCAPYLSAALSQIQATAPPTMCSW